MVLHVGYDVVNLSDKRIADTYNGETKEDYYGRRVPKSAHGSVNLNEHTSSGHLITEAVVGLFDEITDKSLFIRRMSVTANNVIGEAEAAKENEYVQMSIFDLIKEEDDSNTEQLEKEKNIQKAVLEIKDKYGNNAILKGANFIEGATARERNRQIGGHRA
jgi:DNA polymerase V